MKIAIYNKNQVVTLETSLSIKDVGYNMVRIQGEDKHGVFCRVLTTKQFHVAVKRCIDNPDLKLEDLIKRIGIPKYGHYEVI